MAHYSEGGGGGGGSNWFSNLFNGLLPASGGASPTAAAAPASTPPHAARAWAPAAAPRRRFTLEELRSLCASLEDAGNAPRARPRHGGHPHEYYRGTRGDEHSAAGNSAAAANAAAAASAAAAAAQQVEAVRSLAEYMLWADQHGDDPPGILDFLLEANVMRLLARALARPAEQRQQEQQQLRGRGGGGGGGSGGGGGGGGGGYFDGRGEVARQVLQTVGIVVQSVRSAAALYLLLSGGRVNALLEVDLDLEGDDEALGHYASLIKTLALRLDAATVPFFLVVGGETQGGDGGAARALGAGASASGGAAAAAALALEGASLSDDAATATAAAAAAEGNGRRAAAGGDEEEGGDDGGAEAAAKQPQQQQQQQQEQRMANARFPLYTRAIALAHHRDGMVRAAARTVTLCVFGVREQPPADPADQAAEAAAAAAAATAASTEPGMGNAAAAAAAAAGLTAASAARVSSPGPFSLDGGAVAAGYDQEDDADSAGAALSADAANANNASAAAAAAATDAAPPARAPPAHHPDVVAFVTSAPAARGYFDELAAYLSRQAMVLDGSAQAAAARVDAMFEPPAPPPHASPPPPQPQPGQHPLGGGGPAPGFTPLQQSAQAALSELDSHLAEVEDVASYAGDVAAVAAPPVSRALGEALWRGVVEPLLLRPLAAEAEAAALAAAALAAAAENGGTPPPPPPPQAALPLCLITALYVAERLLMLVPDAALAHRLIAALMHARVLPGLLSAASGRVAAASSSSLPSAAGAAAAAPPLAAAVAAGRRSHFALRLIVAATTCRHASPLLLTGLLGATAPTKSMRAAAEAAGRPSARPGAGGDDGGADAVSLATIVREVDEALMRVLGGGKPGKPSTTSCWPPPPDAAREATRAPLLSAVTAALSAPAAPPAAVALAAFALHDLGAGCDAPADDPLADAAEAGALAAVDAAQAALSAHLEQGMWPDAAAPLLAAEWAPARERALRPRGALLRASAEALLCAPHAQPMLAACAPPPRGWVPVGLGGGGGAGGAGGSSPERCSSRRPTPLPPDDATAGAAAAPSGRPSSARPGSSLAGAAPLLPPSAAALRAHAAATASLASAPAPPRLPHLSRSAREAVGAAAAAGRLCAALQAADLLRAGVIPPQAPHAPPLTDADLRAVDVQEGHALESVEPSDAARCVVSFAPGRERRVVLAVAGGRSSSMSTSSPQLLDLLRDLPVAVLADPHNVSQSGAAAVDADAPFGATVLSVAPLVSAEPSPDPSVARWLHVHVRPSVRGLLRVVRSGGGAGGLAAAGGGMMMSGGGGGGGGGGAQGSAAKRGGVVVAARALADGHWVLSFADAESSATAAKMLRARAATLRRALVGALAPLVGLDEGVEEQREDGGGEEQATAVVPAVAAAAAAATTSPGVLGAAPDSPAAAAAATTGVEIEAAAPEPPAEQGEEEEEEEMQPPADTGDDGGDGNDGQSGGSTTD